MLYTIFKKDGHALIIIVIKSVIKPKNKEGVISVITISASLLPL